MQYNDIKYLPTDCKYGLEYLIHISTQALKLGGYILLLYYYNYQVLSTVLRRYKNVFLLISSEYILWIIDSNNSLDTKTGPQDTTENIKINS